MGRRRDRGASISKELQVHLDMAIRDRIERGESPEQARRAALRELGNVPLIIEDSRDVWRWTALEQLWVDLRGGFRILTRAKALSLSAILLIALVIGGNTTIFSAAHSIVNKPAPGISPTGLVSPGWTRNDESDPRMSWPDYTDLASASRTVDLAAFHQARFTMRIPSGVYSVAGEMVTANYFSALRQTAARGRLLSHDGPGQQDGLTAVLGHRLWRTLFDGREDVVGTVVTLNNRAVTIIGVASESFEGPWTGQAANLWVPIEHAAALSPSLKLSDRGERVLDGSVGRLRQGISLEQAQAELPALAAALPVTAPPKDGDPPRVLSVFPYTGTAARDIGIIRRMPTFMAIFSVITLVTLVIVSANVSNLMLARALTRQREMALRQSLGASRVRVVRVVLAEGCAVAVVAWVAACLFAWWTSQLLPSLIPPSEGGDAPLRLDFRPDWITLMYAFGLAIVGTAALSLAPAISTWRQDLLSFLKAGERGSDSRGARASRALVVTQLALAVTLLAGTGLAFRSLSLIDSTDTGFKTGGITLVTLDTRQAVTGGAAVTHLLDRITSKLSAVPGVRAVTYSSLSPSWSWPDAPVSVPGLATPVEAERSEVGPGHLAALGKPVVEGREFNGTAEDRSSAVITRTLAARLWPDGRSALGQTVSIGEPGRIVTVVGVAPDAYYGGFRNSGHPALVFLPATSMSDETAGYPTIYVHSTDAAHIGPDIRRALAEVDSRVPIMRLRPLDSDLGDISWMSRVMTQLLSFFALGSLVIAALGQYAAMAFAAQRRTRELAIRLALGASGRQVAGEVLGTGMKLTAAGLLIGLMLGSLAGRLAQGLLYGTGPADPISLGSVTAALAVISLLACYIPAWRASRVDPLAVLRQE